MIIAIMIMCAALICLSVYNLILHLALRDVLTAMLAELKARR